MNLKKKERSGLDDDDLLSTDYVVKLLERDARSLTRKFSKNHTVGGHVDDNETRDNSTVLRPNTNFLRKIIKESDSHNRALLNRERQQATERMIQQEKSRKQLYRNQPKRERSRSRSPPHHYRRDEKYRRENERDHYKALKNDSESNGHHSSIEGSLEKKRRLSLERQRERERELIRRRKLDLQRESKKDLFFFDSREVNDEVSSSIIQRHEDTLNQNEKVNGIINKLNQRSTHKEKTKTPSSKDTKRSLRKDNKNQISISYSDSGDEEGAKSLPKKNKTAIAKSRNSTNC